MFINFKKFDKTTMSREYLRQKKKQIGNYVDKFLFMDVTGGYTPKTSNRYKLLQTSIEIVRGISGSIGASGALSKITEEISKNPLDDFVSDLIRVGVIALPYAVIFGLPYISLGTSADLFDRRYRDNLNRGAKVNNTSVSSKKLPNIESNTYTKFSMKTEFLKYFTNIAGMLGMGVGSIDMGLRGLNTINRNITLLGGLSFILSSGISGYKKDIAAKVDVQTQLDANEEIENGNGLEEIANTPIEAEV